MGSYFFIYGTGHSLEQRIFLQIMITGIVYGIAMEIVQKYFIPFRSFDLGDIIADAIGCVVGYFFAIKKFSSR